MMIKKCLLVFVSLSIIQASEITAQQSYGDIPATAKSTFFQESFDNNSNNWILDNLWLKGDIVYGGYNLICRNYQKSTGLSYKNIFIDQQKDYEIETAVYTLKGNGGLAFGITGKYDHYRIGITANNTLTIEKNTPSKGKIEELYSGSVSSNLKPGSYNKITVRKLKDYFYIFVNETFIGRFDNIKPEGDKLGFNVGLNSEISVDYLTVSYLSSQASPVTAERNITKEDPAKTQSENIAVNIPSSTNTSKIPKGSTAPLITWTSPSGVNTTLDSYTARVRANIKSGSELKSVLFYVNGASKGEGEIKSSPVEAGTYVAEKTISLNPGDNNVFVIATNFEGASRSELRYFNNPPANPPVIAWGNPVYEKVSVNSDQFTIEACIESPTELRSAKILVNGNPQGENTVFQVSGIEKCNYKWQQSVILKEGDNSIYIIATNIAGSTTSEKRTVKYQMAIVEKRLALVFGNSDYSDKTSLKNPVNDANLMEATLKELGFEVIKRTNAGINAMREAVREFSSKLSEYNVALFYYAGHGIQMEGKNYLIPTDAVLKDPGDCKYEAIPVDFVTEEFAKYPENTNIVILDACRNNPYRNWTRGGAQGFKAISPTSGTIIAFATSEGSTANDGTSANGLYTEELVKQMVIPQPIESVFKKTRVEVKKRSKDQQTPVDWTSLDGDFYFKK
jgi:hypothetical protein